VKFASRRSPGWRTYDVKRRATLRFDVASEVVNDSRSAEWPLWEGVRYVTKGESDALGTGPCED